jgi:hypothetical protein
LRRASHLLSIFILVTITEEDGKAAQRGTWVRWLIRDQPESKLDAATAAGVRPERERPVEQPRA